MRSKIRTSFPVFALFTAIIFFSPILSFAAPPSSISVEKPAVLISGIPFEVRVGTSTDDPTPYTLVIEKDGETVFSHQGKAPETVTDIVVAHSGRHQFTVSRGAESTTESTRALPGFVTILPPLLSIAMALLLRQVVIALFAGIWLGALFVNDFNIVRSFFYVVDHYVVNSFTGASGTDHVSIAIFTLLLGGMVGVFSSIGGTQGVVNQISRIATTPRRGQLATWLMGIAIFFDDYTNTLIVGNTMRPITDKLKISREKLSYIVDSTAAPVVVIAVITSWIGFEISLIKDAFISLGIDRNPFTTFVASIQYSFYPILTLFFGLLVAVSTRDFGPMLKAEIRSRRTGRVLSDKAVPLSNIDTEIKFDSAKSPRWYNAAIPVAVVVLGTFAGLVVTGRIAIREAGITEFTLMDTVRESNSFVALLWSSLAGCVTAIVLGVVQRLATLTEAISAWVAGIRSMVFAIVILVLAWCIGSVCTDLQTPDYLVTKVSGFITPELLPTIIFLIASGISFSTGTSWGTMTILTPITIPLVIRISELNAVTPGAYEAILLSSISAILAGSVFGDHCSPISDTTIMSSMASASDHIDHVRTQLPYAVTVGLISIFFGYLPAGFNIPPELSFLVSAILIVGVIWWFGKSEKSYLDADVL